MDVQQRISVQDGNHTPTECLPFAVALALVLLPLADDPRIDADAGIVQKNAPVDFTDMIRSTCPATMVAAAASMFRL